MQIISIGLFTGLFIRIRRHQADRRIIDPLFPLVIILLDRFFSAFFCMPSDSSLSGNFKSDIEDEYLFGQGLVKSMHEF